MEEEVPDRLERLHTRNIEGVPLCPELHNAMLLAQDKSVCGHDPAEAEVETEAKKGADPYSESSRV